MPNRNDLIRGFVAIAAVTSLSACGSSTPTEGENGLTPVTLMVVPTTAQAPVYLAEEQGLFEEYGLDITIESAADGSAVTAAVSSGDATFGAGGLSAQILAVGQGVPVKVVAAQSGEDRPGSLTDPVADGMVYVRADSGITAPADLRGRSIAVNGLVSNSSMVLQAALANQGVEPGSYEMTQVNFPEQLSALEQGQVDAIVSAEPFSTQAAEAGMTPLMNTFPFDESGPQTHIISSWFTGTQTATESPELIENFRQGLAAAQRNAADNPDALLQSIVGYTNIPADQAEKMVLPAYPEETDTAIIDAEIELVRQYLDLEGSPTSSDVLAP